MNAARMRLPANRLPLFACPPPSTLPLACVRVSDRISPAAPHELLPALRLLAGGHNPPSPMNGDNHAGLFVARDSTGRVCGAIRAEVMPGAMGVLVPPQAETPDDAEALARTACEWLRSFGVKVCQAYATAENLVAVPLLETQGFRHVTRALLLRFERKPYRDSTQPCDTLEGRYYQPELRDVFAQTWLATQEHSLDCPELEQGRTPAERAAGFELPNGSSTRHFLAEAGSNPLGVVITELGADGVLSINYLGVVAAARGRGLGRTLLAKVLHEGVPFVALAEVCVDARNHPALRLYQRFGFSEFASREVFIAYLPELLPSG